MTLVDDDYLADIRSDAESQHQGCCYCHEGDEDSEYKTCSHCESWFCEECFYYHEDTCEDAVQKA